MPIAFVSWSTEVFFIPSVTAHRRVSFSSALRSCSVSYSVKAKISPFHLWPLWSFRSYYVLFLFLMQVLFLQALLYQVFSWDFLVFFWSFPGIFWDFSDLFPGLFRSFQVMSCFSASYCIFILLFCAAGMNFFWPDSSPACSFLPQGWFRPPRFIPSLLFFSTRMISFSWIHPQLVFFFRREYEVTSHL